MKVMVLTGGVATGKSTVMEMMRRFFAASGGLWKFDADQVVHGLWEDEAVKKRIQKEFAKEKVVDGEGNVARERLREVVFSDEGARERLEGILHPLVRQEFLESLKKAANGGGGARLFVADIPLFFESCFDYTCDEVLVAGVSRETQIRRLKERNGFPDGLIEKILTSQLPIHDKIERADRVFWNEGSRLTLQKQVVRFSQQIE